MKKLRIKHFRGVIMRETLLHTNSRPNENECGIINLGDIVSGGTHWTCYAKRGKDTFYFDSFGDVNPPREFVKYLGSNGIKYNGPFEIQTFSDPPVCGHLCLEVLRRHSKGQDWNSIVRALRNDKYVWRSWFCE